ncbi:LANO_0D00276g1_1 [Lachancea nothofagi CBS 11611]|uniref:LANO_0D00276g1_1 n=1 Tax=Lachancea nothofagi CBS 11611 TaxID=1266666 RepID=A0A1G4JCK4_9SACH|nr:LANO_0D00276g1_1 [Lachancea nothofagi CBS 11611]
MELCIKDSEGLAIISCHQCRKRKVKCSRDFPACEYCAKKEYNCSYPQTTRKKSTKIAKKRKQKNIRFYGLSSVNQSLFENGMPFCNPDCELMSKNSPANMKSFKASTVFKKYIKDPQYTLEAIKCTKENLICPLFVEALDLNDLQQILLSKKSFDYTTLLLFYSVIIVSERFITPTPDIENLVEELNLVLNECPDCPEKVTALVLLADYYHLNSKIETAWKSNFLATSIAYALGLHLTVSKEWAMLVLHDALLSLLLGRPSSITYHNLKLIGRPCDWRTIALLLRDSNEMLLTPTSLTIDKVVILDLQHADLIKKIKQEECIQDEVTNPRKELLVHMKLCILISNRVKVLHPVYPKYGSLMVQMDKNCSELINCVRNVLKIVASASIGEGNKPYCMRSHFFLAYCSVFQALLLHLIFCSTQTRASFTESSSENDSFTPPPTTERTTIFPPSLQSMSMLLQEYDQVSEKIDLCRYMLDVFDSFRTLIAKRSKDKGGTTDTVSNTSSPYPLWEDSKCTDSNLLGNLENSKIGENNEAGFPKDFADWISTLLSGTSPYVYPSE